MKHCFRFKVVLFLVLSLVLVTTIGGTQIKADISIPPVLSVINDVWGGGTSKRVYSGDICYINAKKEEGYKFVNWTQIGGPGNATFEDDCSANTVVTVTGGNVTIKANFINEFELLDANQVSINNYARRLKGKIGQSFTANYTGKLSRVELLLSASSVYCGPMDFTVTTFKINIIRGSDLTGDVIGSAKGGLAPSGPNWNYHQWYNLPLDNVMVTKGQKYVIEIIDMGGDLPVNLDISDFNPYPGGTAFTWNETEQKTEEQPSEDFLFRTYVIPDVIKVDFQPANAEIPDGCLPDYGDIYGHRNGYVYGWNNQGCWEIEAANGTYEVTAEIGDALYDGTYSLNVEGVNYWDQILLKAGSFNKLTRFITVWDGKITVSPGNLGYNSIKMNSIEIRAIPSLPEILSVSVPWRWDTMNNNVESDNTAQSFTANHTGELTRVGLILSNNQPGAVKINLRKGTDLSGPIIASSKPFKLNNNCCQWCEFLVKGIRVIKGEKYLIEVVNTTSNPVKWRCSYTDAYSGGAAYQQNQEQPWDFAFETYVIMEDKDTLVVAKTGGGSTNPPGAVRNNDGVVRRISATPDDGYWFVNWNKTDGNGAVEFGNANAAETTVTLTGGSAGIQANFSLLPGYNVLTVTNDGNGVTDPADSVAVYYSDSREITATPNDGYYFVNWTKTGDGTGTVTFEDANSATTRVTVSGGDVTIKANFAEISLTEGLAGYWKFEEGNGTTVTDSSLNNHNGDLMGSAQWVVGHNGSGILLNNQTKDYINLGSTDFGLTNELTVSAWVKTNGSTGADQVLIRRGQYVYPFSLALEHSASLMPFKGCIRTNGTFYATSSVRINTGEWHHVVMTYRSGAMVMYLDGKEVARNNNPIGDFQFGYGVSETYIGAGSGSEANGFFNGVIDEFRIYNRALNPVEVVELFKYNPAE